METKPRESKKAADSAKSESEKRAGQKEQVGRKAAGHTRDEAKELRARRVRHCAELMARGEWVPGITGQEVADKFGVSPRTVEAYSAEASRIIRSAVANDDDLRAMMIATLQTIVGRSMKGRQMRTAVEAIKAMAGITGVEPPKRHSVNVENDLASLYNLVHDGGDNNASPRS